MGHQAGTRRRGPSTSRGRFAAGEEGESSFSATLISHQFDASPPFPTGTPGLNHQTVLCHSAQEQLASLAPGSQFAGGGERQGPLAGVTAAGELVTTGPGGGASERAR